MKKYYTKEAYLRYAEQQNINCENAIKAVECLIETVKQFDGKVYNVRFDRKFEEILSAQGLRHTYLTMEYGLWQLYVRDDDSHKDNPTAEYSSCSYVDYRYYMPKLFDIDKRIYADKLMPLLIERQETIKRQIANTKADMVRFDDIKAEYDDIRRRIEAFNSSVTPGLRELFKINNIY